MAARFPIEMGLGKRKVLKQAGQGIELDEKEFAYDQALGQIGFWKNSLVFQMIFTLQDDWEKSCLFLYKKYEEYKQQTGKFDFDDMLVGCYLFLKNHPELFKKYQQRFNYFLVDEFQDINKVQYELIKSFLLYQKMYVQWEMMTNPSIHFVEAIHNIF